MQQAAWKQHAANIGYFLLTTFFVAGAAFFNKYPLVRDLSGVYLESGFTLRRAMEDPMTYPLFIRAVTWQATAWTIVLAQAMLLNVLLMRVTRLFAPEIPLRVLHFPLIVFLTMFTSMSWMVSTIHPDIFLPMVLLAATLLLFDRELRRWQQLGLGILILAGLSMTDVFMLIGFLGAIFLLIYFGIRFTKLSVELRKRLLGLMLLLALPLGLTQSYDLLAGKGARYDAGAIFRITMEGAGSLFPQLISSNFTHYPLMWEDNPDFLKAYTAKTVKERVPHEFGEYMNGRQNRDNLHLWYLPWLNLPLQGLSILGLIWGMWRWKPEAYWKGFTLMLAAGILVSAWGGVIFYGEDEFTGARMSWLLVLAAVLMLAPRMLMRLPFEKPESSGN